MPGKEQGGTRIMSREQTQGDTRGSKGSFAFLVHSQESLSQQTQPEIDNQRLARQKRRRTSPEDHAILEAEYEQNPKPDKTARMEIVKRVALGEKEVQIWFQNRRQVTRRKSRPLLPHEILANLQPSSQDSEHDPCSSNPFDESSQPLPASSQSSLNTTQTKPYSISTGSVHDPSQGPSSYEKLSSDRATSSKAGTGDGPGPAAANVSQEYVPESQDVRPISVSASSYALPRGNFSRSFSQSLPKKRGQKSLANRRASSFVIHDEHEYTFASATQAVPRQESVSGNMITPIQPLKRTSSLVRLSMSLDGKAQVTTSTGSTPSPPRSQPVPSSGPFRRPHTELQRSFSAIEAGRDRTPGTFRRPPTGRSRDARTWEFYCDKDARDALTEQAEREESGSATAAIALIKSNSNTSKAMVVNPNKRNAHSQKSEAAKRLKGNGQKPKLGRSQSSVASMQTVSQATPQEEIKAKKLYRKSGAQSATFEEYDGDSDKENWVPGTRRASPRRRPVASAQSRRVLEESLRNSPGLSALMSQEHSMSRSASSFKSGSSEEKENRGAEIDEVADFMGGAGPSREADDLDCVQNLLSLSQAAWQ